MKGICFYTRAAKASQQGILVLLNTFLSDLQTQARDSFINETLTSKNMDNQVLRRQIEQKIEQLQISRTGMLRSLKSHLKKSGLTKTEQLQISGTNPKIAKQMKQAMVLLNQSSLNDYEKQIVISCIVLYTEYTNEQNELLKTLETLLEKDKESS